VRFCVGRNSRRFRSRSTSAAELTNVRSTAGPRSIIRSPDTGVNRHRKLRHTVHFGRMDRPIVPESTKTRAHQPKNRFADALDGVARGIRRLSSRIRGDSRNPSTSGWQNLQNEEETRTVEKKK
ncbi:hypothetical protein PENTCL1PPCAC_28838, partial [Pristionchus entomophagus]